MQLLINNDCHKIFLENNIWLLGFNSQEAALVWNVLRYIVSFAVAAKQYCECIFLFFIGTLLSFCAWQKECGCYLFMEKQFHSPPFVRGIWTGSKLKKLTGYYINWFNAVCPFLIFISSFLNFNYQELTQRQFQIYLRSESWKNLPCLLLPASLLKTQLSN